MNAYQLFKQGPGACDLDGSSMDPGWYWVKQRPNEISAAAPPIPYGLSTGPFKTKREAERNARRNSKHVHVGVGYCPICKHYGEDCTGEIIRR